MQFDWTIRVTDIVMILAVLVGPVIAVLITLWAQSQNEKDAEKRRLFLTLMAERQFPAISHQVAQSLNTIDVVFSGNSQVILAWHRYYALLAQPHSQDRVHTWLELLSAMATVLGYSIQQTDLDKFYLPQGHADDLEFQRKTSQQWGRVLENTERFLVEARKEDSKTIEHS